MSQAQAEAQQENTEQPIDHIMVLRCDPALYMTKRAYLDSTGHTQFRGYDDAKYYDAIPIPVSDLDCVAALLKGIAPNPHVCVIRGALIDPSSTKHIRRLKHDQTDGAKATFKEQPRWWVTIDLDDIPLDGIDPEDLQACAERALEYLPAEFREAECIVQASSRHGYLPTMRLRLWFWLSRPVGEQELNSWFDGCTVDFSVFRTVQPIYVAAPVFEGGLVDVLPERMIQLDGDAVVRVPDDLKAPEAETKERAEKGERAERSEEGSREPITQEDVERILASTLAQLKDAPDGQKHTVLYRAAFTVGGLMVHKGWTEDEAVGRLLAALQSAKDWGAARQTAFDGVRAGAQKPFVVVDEPEFDAADGPEQDGRESSEQPPSALILSLNNPVRSAREFIKRKYRKDGRRTLHHQAGVFFRWTGTHYEEVAVEEVRAATYGFLDKAKRLDKDSKPVPFHPKRNAVGDVLEALRGVAQLLGTTRAPAWLGNSSGLPPAAEILACKNGLLHLPTRALLAHTPQFFSLNALDYAFDPTAPVCRSNG